MSTHTSPDDWRAQALRNLEAAEQEPAEGSPVPVRSSTDWPLLAAKLVIFVILSVGLIYFGGWGFAIAPIFVAWLLFWPR